MATETAGKSVLLTAGAIFSAIGASLCCLLPLAVAVLGVGSAALGAWFEPVRPLFLALTMGFLSYAFYRAYRREECGEGESCAVPARRRRQRLLLWLMAPVVILLMTFPYYVEWLY